MTSFNWVDNIFLGLFASSIILGFLRGFVREILSITNVIAAIAIGIFFAKPFANYLTHDAFMQQLLHHLETSAGIKAASFPLTYISIGVAFSIIIGGVLLAGSVISAIINLAFQTGLIGLLNRLLGALFGFARAFLISLVLVFGIQLTSFAANNAWQQSRTLLFFQPTMKIVNPYILPTIDKLKSKTSQLTSDALNKLQNVLHSN